MTLRHLLIFVTVCECHTVTEAAKRLYMAQPAVSLAIRELENHYDVRLFDRIGRRLHLTEPGQQVLGYARHILDSNEELEQQVKNWSNRGSLRIGASITIGSDLLPDMVLRFKEQYKEIQLRASIDQSLVLEQKILRNELDLAMIEGMVHDEYILAQDFMDDELVLVSRPGRQGLPEGIASLSQIQDQPFILREKGSGTRELFDSVMLTHGLLISPFWESVSTEAIIRAVSAGIGLSVLPLRLVAEDLERGILERVFLSDAEFRRQFRLIYHKDKYLTAAMKAFIQHCLSYDSLIRSLD